LLDISNNRYGSDLTAPEDNLEDDDASDITEEFQDIGDDNESSDEPSNFEKKHPSRSSMPTWIDNEYKAIRDKVMKEIKDTGLPACYVNGTFSMGSENPFLLHRTKFTVNPDFFYHQPFFIWLPHCLLGDRIPCPACLSNCRKTFNNSAIYLQSLGWVEKARRVVDINHNIFIAGWRYRCGSCNHIYRSWSPAILNVLPKALAAQFSFQLTFRSGLTDQLAALLRESFRSGIGPDKFMQMIQSFHYRHYDQLHLQYLQMIKARKDGILGSFHCKSGPFSTFRDRDGYAGFIPSAPYFRMFYDKMVEADAPELVQLIATLSARVLAMDHSFKVF
jgi:hypothetical protein